MVTGLAEAVLFAQRHGLDLPMVAESARQTGIASPLLDERIGTSGTRFEGGGRVEVHLEVG